MYDRHQLIGAWYRSVSGENGQYYTELAKLNADGSFEFDFLTYDSDGELSDKTAEMGLWGLVGDIHFTVTCSERVDDVDYNADGENPDNYHVYRVITLTEQEFSYQHIASAEVFTLTRVVSHA